jgi:hypothetical protein
MPRAELESLHFPELTGHDVMASHRLKDHEHMTEIDGRFTQMGLIRDKIAQRRTITSNASCFFRILHWRPAPLIQ